ncbi:endonuclease III [Geomonas sp. Red32]|uniref:endonuclease III domain-containing protein n=1 Tax=Geomonas sp. Red32 TaxID=2912856 RepID=UPI00202CD5AC|nr:endonuclease III [Geomonas sp. Red32]MCM0083211.1 endonuclease III [Geomonas sp. Red32]
MKDDQIHQAMAIVAEAVTQWVTPAVTIVATQDGDPFKVLVSCILSLRTRDQVTAETSGRLFALADTPEKLIHLSVDEIEKAIYPAGFYRNKARQILEISRELVERYGSQVPDDLDELLKFNGVGRKTANLVLTLGFGKAGICVDTHVHRICNRWGYIKTRNPEETEKALRLKLPSQYWIPINDMLVTFGQNMCTPLSPKCSQCPLYQLCDRAGVSKFR